jgi:hypothetical protein
MGQRWDDDAKLRRHNEDEQAHGEALKPVWAELRAMQKFTWMVAGGLIVLSTLVMGGLIGLLGHGAKLW